MVSRHFLRNIHKAWIVLGISYGIVLAQEFDAPAGYYAGAEGLQGDALKMALHNAIDNHNVRSYDDFKLAARALDRDPDNADNLILLYSGESFPSNQFGASGEVWNREHVWPQSYGVDNDDPNFNSVGHSDMHHLFPALAGVNSERLNRYFDWTDPDSTMTHPRAPGSTYDGNSWEPRDKDKGRVARAILYMAIRYEGFDDEKISAFGSKPPDLKLGDRANIGSQTMGKLTPLLEWNRMYAPDQREQFRNHGIYEGVQWGTRTYKQGNRNPFVDHPEFADAIFTADEFVSYGSWRIRHFTTAELLDPTLSGDLADPDLDRLPNLIELAMNADPGIDTTEFPMQVTTNGTSSVIEWIQIKQAGLSGIAYTIESSGDPWNSDSWSELIEGELSHESINAFTESVTFSTPPANGTNTQYYRLRVNRDFPVDDPGEAVFDPALYAGAQGSIFAYDETVSTGWRDSGWLSYAFTATFPWIYQQMHKWLHVEAETPHSVWMHDEYLGWFWSSDALYPIAYSAERDGWIRFVGGAEPDRIIRLLDSGLEISESTF